MLSVQMCSSEIYLETGSMRWYGHIWLRNSHGNISLVLHKLQIHFAQLRLILPYAALLKPQRQKVKPINQFLNCFIFCIFHHFISSNSCVNCCTSTTVTFRFKFLPTMGHAYILFLFHCNLIFPEWSTFHKGSTGI